MLKKIEGRLYDLPTEKNVNKYNEYLAKCKDLCNRIYNNVGLNNESNVYAWDRSSQFQKVYIDMGDDKDGFSFYPNSVLYMTPDCGSWIIKHLDTNKLVRYEDTETVHLKKYGSRELIKIHNLKVNVEGEIVNHEKRVTSGKKNKGLS